MDEEEDDKIAVKRQIDEFMTTWRNKKPEVDQASWLNRKQDIDQKDFHVISKPPSLSECEEVFRLGPVKIELDSSSDEEEVSSAQDFQQFSDPLDVKPNCLVEEEEHHVRRLVVKITDVCKYLVKTQQDAENITEGFSVDLKNVKGFLDDSIPDDDNDDVPGCNGDNERTKYDDGRYKADDDYADDYREDDVSSCEDDDRDKDYEVEEEEEEDEEEDFESDEENSESSDDDWTPVRREKKFRSMKSKSRHKKAALNYVKLKANFDSLAGGDGKRLDDLVKETKPVTKLQMLGSLRSNSHSFVTSEKSPENPGSDEDGMSVQGIPSDSSDVTAHEDEELSKHNPLESDSSEVRTNHRDKSEMEDKAIKQEQKDCDRSHQKERKETFPCLVCDKTYSTKYKLKSLKRVHTCKRKFECHLCGKIYKKTYNLKDHLQRHTGERPFKCSICGKRFFSSSNLHSHKSSVHSDERPFKCQVCGSTYKHKVALRKHVPVSCSVCNKRFCFQRKLDLHIRTHSDLQKCRYCGKQIDQMKSLMCHENICITPKSFQCQICSFSSKFKKHLAIHMRYHTGEKPFLCQFCGKKWATKGELTQHEVTHTGERRYKCQFCGKAFRRNSHWRRHERIHNGEKSYKCQYCDQHFTTREIKIYHERRKHLGDKTYGQRNNRIPYKDKPKKFKCSFCDKMFVLTCERSLHERENHTGVKPFFCSVCGRKFSRRRRAVAHELKAHKNKSIVKQVEKEPVLETLQHQPKRKYRITRR